MLRQGTSPRPHPAVTPPSPVTDTATREARAPLSNLSRPAPRHPRHLRRNDARLHPVARPRGVANCYRGSNRSISQSATAIAASAHANAWLELTLAPSPWATFPRAPTKADRRFFRSPSLASNHVAKSSAQSMSNDRTNSINCDGRAPCPFRSPAVIRRCGRRGLTARQCWSATSSLTASTRPALRTVRYLLRCAAYFSRPERLRTMSANSLSSSIRCVTPTGGHESHLLTIHPERQ